MRLLQVLVEPVLSVAPAVLVQALDFLAEVLPDPFVDPGVLVDVIAQVNDEVEVLLLHVGVAVEITCFVMLAGGEGEAHGVGHGAWGGRGAGAPDRAGLRPGVETVVVPAVRIEPIHLDVDGVAELRQGEGFSLADYLGEGLVPGNLPLDPDGLGVQPATGERVGGKPGPEHGPVGFRVSRGHAQGEGVGGKTGRLDDAPVRALVQPGNGRDHRHILQELPAGNAILGRSGGLSGLCHVSKNDLPP